MSTSRIAPLALLVCMLAGCQWAKSTKVTPSDDSATFVGLSESTLLPDAGGLVWRAELMQECSIDAPRAMAPAVAPLFAALGELFLGKAIDFGVHAFAQAMAEAAKLDREGLTFSTTNPSYLYDTKLIWPTGSAPSSENMRVAHQRHACIAVVRGRRATNVSQTVWCPPAATELCEGSRAQVLNALGERLQLQKPSFYAEIRLRTSDTRDAMSGELALLYYPLALTQRSGDTRDLLISATLRSPKADPAMGDAVAVFAFALKDLEPGAAHEGPLGSSVAGWSPLPAPIDLEHLVPLAKSVVGPTPSPGTTTESGSMQLTVSSTLVSLKLLTAPTTLTASIRETGNVNAFLQYLSGWLSTDAAQAAIAAPIKSAVLPSASDARDTAAAAERAGVISKYHTAIDAAFAAMGAYQAQCESAPALQGAAHTRASALLVEWERAHSTARSSAQAAAMDFPTALSAPAQCASHG